MPLSLDDSARTPLIHGIQRYFRDERGEGIGELQAGFLLDFVLAGDRAERVRPGPYARRAGPPRPRDGRPRRDALPAGVRLQHAGSQPGRARAPLTMEASALHRALAEDRRWMKVAFREAERAFDAGEVPVGAVVVRHGPHGAGEVVGRGRNAVEALRDAPPTPR